MDDISKPERVTQNRVMALFRDELKYHGLGDWSDRDNNRQIEDSLLSDWLTRRGCSPAQINAALYKLHTEADNPSRTLYENNQAVYQLLRYGIPVQTQVGHNHETVHLIDWADPEANNFAIAEEVTLRGGFERRPDLVLYVKCAVVTSYNPQAGDVSLEETGADALNLQDEVGPLPMPDPKLKLAVDIDEAIKRERHADWRGNAARENHIKREALLPLLSNDVAEVERIFDIIKQQPEY